MPRKTIQKNLAYDTERRLYYAVFREDGRRYTRTYHTREEAQAALEGRPYASRRLPGKDCSLRDWLLFWLEEVVARDRAESTLYMPIGTWPGAMCCRPWERSHWQS